MLAAPAAVLAQNAAEDLLQGMHDATRHLNYDGIFVYQRGGQMDSMRIVHKYHQGTEVERLISLSGPAREVIRDGALVTFLFADGQEAMVEKNPPLDLTGIGFSAPVEQLVGHYSFSVRGEDRVAGRHALVVSIAPLGVDRYGYRLWVDAQSKLLLKSMILSPGGRTLEQVQFTQIAILDEVPDEHLRAGIAGTEFTWRTDSDGGAGAREGVESGWSVQWLPDGFELKDSNIQRIATSAMPVSHLVFSDGLAMVSVFVEELTEGAKQLQGSSSRGAVNAFSRVANDYQITVVGEVPLPTVKQIAHSVARSAN